MVWTEKLKLNKQLTRSISDAGLVSPREIQLKTLTRISGGEDLIAIAPEGSGKTTTCVLSALNKFRQGYDDAPRVLLLAPLKEDVLQLLEQFALLNKNKTIRIVGLYAMPGMEAQLDALADGADIVVATPDRARAIYLKLALNLNRIQLLILDDADRMVKQGLQLPVAELANSIVKCQHLVFTEVMHAKLDAMIQPFIQAAVTTIEIDLDPVQKLVTHAQLLYQVPNFRTKLNLLGLFLDDTEVFTKVLVIINSPATADKLFQSLKRPVQKETLFYKQLSAEGDSIGTLEEFIKGNARILLALSATVSATDPLLFPFVIHFEIPDPKDLYVERITRQSGDDPGPMFLTFATDIELSAVSKIQQETGVRIPVAELPESLKIETEPAKSKKTAKSDPDPVAGGAAFHTRKASNSKTYNYGSGQKAKMTMKKKHG